MNSKKIIINENKMLFKILDEIKDNFNFDLINIDSKTLKNLKLNKFFDLLITFNDDEKNDPSSLVLKNFPIKLEKLIQLINIQFLKNKFNLQSKKKLKIKWLSKRLIKEKIYKKNRLKNWSIKNSNIKDIIDIISQ